jgi:hypothetical protein
MQNAPADKHSNDHPLGLTVYDLPAPQEVAAADAKRTAQGRWRMLLVLLICAAPVVASYFTYYVVRPEGRRNHGELIQPTRALPDLVTRDLQGVEGQLGSLKGQWLLISVSSGACDERCQQHLYLQRQILTGLGRDRDRTDWVWLITDDAPVPESMAPGLKEAVILRVSSDALKSWLAPASGQALSDHLFLVDPMGEWMMRFGPQITREEAPRIKKDLERLLRASAGWDKAGR